MGLMELNNRRFTIKERCYIMDKTIYEATFIKLVELGVTYRHEYLFSIPLVKIKGAV